MTDKKSTEDKGADLMLYVKRIKEFCMAGEGSSFDAIKSIYDLERDLEGFVVSILAKEMREAENA